MKFGEVSEQKKDPLVYMVGTGSEKCARIHICHRIEQRARADNKASELRLVCGASFEFFLITRARHSRCALVPKGNSGPPPVPDQQGSGLTLCDTARPAPSLPTSIPSNSGWPILRSGVAVGLFCYGAHDFCTPLCFWNLLLAVTDGVATNRCE